MSMDSGSCLFLVHVLLIVWSLIFMFVNKPTTPIDLAWSHWPKYETARCQNLCGLLGDLKVGASFLPRGAPLSLSHRLIHLRITLHSWPALLLGRRRHRRHRPSTTQSDMGGIKNSVTRANLERRSASCLAAASLQHQAMVPTRTAMGT